MRDGRQAIVYSMQLSAAGDLAMILPIPVAEPRHEKQVSFISLKKYPEFFSRLNSGFPQMVRRAPDAATYERGAKSVLEVVKVGSFDASFVPSVADFSRLDPQFRLPDGIWEKLGRYASYGFAVFKLRRGSATVHPMAFTFPSAMPERLFFPTVHVHDGKIHRHADFDHTLYCQALPSRMRSLRSWEESELPARQFVSTRASRDLVLGDAHVYRKALAGMLPNTDTII